MNNSTTLQRVRLLSRAFVFLVVMLGIQYGASAQTSNAAPYCNGANTSGTTFCVDDWALAFTKIQLNAIDFNLPTCPFTRGTYSYYQGNKFPHLTTTLSQGASYTLHLETDQTGFSELYIGVWIDYNRDNDFDDPNEFIGTKTEPNPSGNYVSFNGDFNFTVPCNSTSGKTRMRIRGNPSNFGGPINAGSSCTQWQYGETIDLDVDIAKSGNPSANFYLPDSVFELSEARFLNANPSGYISHAWSTSEGGLGNVISTDNNLDYTFVTPGAYQVRLTSVNCNGTSTITKNINVVAPTTPPNVNFVASTNYVAIPLNDPVVDEIVSFKSFSTSGPHNNAYSWEITPDISSGKWFPAGGSLSEDEVSIFFIDTGEFEVCLTASNAVGATKLCKTKYVVIEYEKGGSKYENTICTDAGSTLDSGVVYDPGGVDGPYPAAVTLCSFTIDACDAEEIEMWFDGTFDIQWDGYVRLYDGPDNNGELLFQQGPQATTARPTKRYVAKSGKATVEFFNQFQWNSGQGFELYWKVKNNNDGPLVSDFNIENTRNDTIYSCMNGTSTLVSFKNKSKGTNKIDDYQWIFDYDPSIAYPEKHSDNALIELGSTIINPVYEYKSDKTYTVRLVTGSCEGWDTSYRTFHIAPTTMLPNVDFEAAETILPLGGTTTLSNRTVAWCSGEWFISPSNYTILNGGSLTDPEIDVKFDVAGRYTVRYTAENDNGSATRTRTDYIKVVDFCKPTIVYGSSGLSISHVKFNTIDNASTASASGYTSFTDLPATTLFIGGTYDLEVSRPQTVDNADRRVWIDYNRDGNFDNTEIVAQDNNSKTPTLKASVTIPEITKVVPGPTRMRVAIGLTGKPVTSCGPLNSGEYEDYSVIIMPDDVPPMITMLGSDTVYVELGSTYDDDSATAMDNLEGDITSRIVTVNQVDVNQTGVYVVTYNVKDGSGRSAPTRTRYVFVLADMTNPVITLNGSATITHEAGTPYTDLGATAMDDPGATDISGFIITQNNVDVTKLGTYTVEYKVTDSYGNTAVEVRTVEVVDTQAPVINLIGGDPMSIQVNSVFVDPTTATDAFEGTVPVQVVSGTVNTGNYGSQYKVTYTAEDMSGNMAAPVTRTYNITDLVPPTIETTPGTQTIIADVNDINFTEPTVEGKDNFFPTVTLTRNAGGFDISKLGTYNITYTATDGAGNVTTWVRTIKVVDRVKPQVISTPVNVMRWTAFDPLAGVSTYDNYYSPSDFINNTNDCRIEIVSTNVNLLAEGIYMVYYQAVDGSGNISELHGRLVNVVANTTSIGDASFENSINIYPNPTSGKFDIELGIAAGTNTTVTIMNMTGQVVKQVATADAINGKVSVDLSDAAAGVYFVQVQSENQSAVKKVTITR